MTEPMITFNNPSYGPWLRERQKQMNYFVIHVSEDGDVSAERMTQQTLEQRLEQSYWGELPKFLTPEDNLETNPGLLIVKGELVIPATVEVVKRWSV